MMVSFLRLIRGAISPCTGTTALRRLRSPRPPASLFHLALTGCIGVLSSTSANAVPLCDSAPTTFEVDSVVVKQPGDTSFEAADAANFCVSATEVLMPGIPDLKFYVVTLNLSAVTESLAYPAETEFRVTVTNGDERFKIGSVSSTAPVLRVAHGGGNGGASQTVSFHVKLSSGQTELVNRIALADPTKGFFSLLNRVILSQSALNSGFPELYFDADTVQFEVAHTFQGCPSEGSFDSYIDAFFPLTVLNRTGLTKSVLGGLTDSMLATMFSASGGDGMKVTEITVRKSYGERQDLGGTSTSTGPTGLIVRMELRNDGWGFTDNNPACVGLLSLTGAAVQTGDALVKSSRKGGFRMKKAARAAIKACTRNKKMRPGYRIQRKGKTIVCVRKTRA